MVLLQVEAIEQPEQPIRHPADALLHVQHAEAVAPVKGAPIKHWALPSEDTVKAEARAEAVVKTTDQMSYLVSSLPSELGGEDYYDIDRDVA